MKLLSIAAVGAWVRAGALPAVPAPPEEEPMVMDDECAALGGSGGSEGACSLSALQLRGESLAAAATASAREVPEVWNNTYLQEFHADLAFDAELESRVQSCQTMFDGLMGGTSKWKVNFWSLNYGGTADTLTSEAVPYKGSFQALVRFLSPSTDNIELDWGSHPCSRSESQVLWFYPKADHNGAYILNDFVCQRLSTFVNDDHTTCLNIYRVDNLQQIDNVLDKFIVDGSVSHVVLGGHGSDDTQGVLYFGSSRNGHQLEQDAETVTMLGKLRLALTTYGTIFLDSCYGAKNGLAKYVSEHLPDAWVFGGVVSLDGDILLKNTGIAEGSDAGPPRICSDKHDGVERVKAFHNGQDRGFVDKFLPSS